MAELCVDFFDSPCVFLFMIDDTKAYIIRHPKIMSKKDTIVEFSYIAVSLADQRVETLFDFSLPRILYLPEILDFMRPYSPFFLNIVAM